MRGIKKVPQIVEFVGLDGSLCVNSAERQGFEPRVPCSTTVFKTAAIDHSATSPGTSFQKCFPLKAVQRYKSFLILQTLLLFFRELIVLLPRNNRLYP